MLTYLRDTHEPVQYACCGAVALGVKPHNRRSDGGCALANGLKSTRLPVSLFSFLLTEYQYLNNCTLGAGAGETGASRCFVAPQETQLSQLCQCVGRERRIVYMAGLPNQNM